MGEFDRVHNRFFFHLFRARFDHQDGVGGADDHDVQQAFAHLRIRGIGDEASVHQTDAHGADRSEEGNVREGERRGGGVDADDVGIVLCVSGQNKNNDLCFAAKTLGKHRPDGAVDLAAGEHFALAHAAFALDEAAGDSSAGVSVFAVINGEREKVDAGAGFGVGDGGGEDNVFAEAHNGRAVRLLGELSGFEGDGLAASDLGGNCNWFRFHKSSFVGRSAERPRHSGVVADRRMPVALAVGKTHVIRASENIPATSAGVSDYLRMPSLVITVLYRSESYFFR